MVRVPMSPVGLHNGEAIAQSLRSCRNRQIPGLYLCFKGGLLRERQSSTYSDVFFHFERQSHASLATVGHSAHLALMSESDAWIMVASAASDAKQCFGGWPCGE